MSFTEIYKMHEKIKCAAVKVNQNLYWGDNHGECIRQLKDNSTQGFLTTLGRFVDRKEALRIARANKQIVKKHAPKDILLSEDLKEFVVQEEIKGE